MYKNKIKIEKMVHEELKVKNILLIIIIYRLFDLPLKSSDNIISI